MIYRQYLTVLSRPYHHKLRMIFHIQRLNQYFSPQRLLLNYLLLFPFDPHHLQHLIKLRTQLSSYAIALSPPSPPPMLRNVDSQPGKPAIIYPHLLLWLLQQRFPCISELPGRRLVSLVHLRHHLQWLRKVHRASFIEHDKHGQVPPSSSLPLNSDLFGLWNVTNQGRILNLTSLIPRCPQVGQRHEAHQRMTPKERTP